MKRFTVALSLLAVLAVAAFAQSNCNGKSCSYRYNSASAFSKSLGK